MKNLAAIVTKEAVIAGLNKIIKQKPVLRSANKYHVIYDNQEFPPKEVIRFAAREMGITDFSKYRLHGGESVHKRLRKLGFEIRQFKENKTSILNKNEKRLSRLTWNDNGWIQPSGRHGKSRDKNSHEARFGYGHEEWIFDMSKLINGFHYGFLEPVRKQQEAYTYNNYDVWLYSIDGITKKRYYIGEIKNVIVIDEEEAATAKQLYKKKGWMKEMESQIKACGANPEGFSNWEGVNLFNIKFKPSDVRINDSYFELSKDHPVYQQSRYAFVYYTNDFEFEVKKTPFEFVQQKDAGNLNDEEAETKTHIREPKSIQITYLHKAISNALTKQLVIQFGKNNVTKEHPTGYGSNRIDIAVNHGSYLSFYEIKTYTSIKTCVREALGQILEYCYYPDEVKAKELIVVSQLPADDETKKYFNQLRQQLKLEIYYQSFDLESKLLSDKY